MKSRIKEKDVLKDFLLVKTLLGLEPDFKLNWVPEEPTPERPSCIFLEKGHVVEYLMVEPGTKRVVTLFFGPGDFIVPCHSFFSILQSLDEATTNTFTYGAVINTLHKFPEVHEHYIKVREEYLKRN